MKGIVVWWPFAHGDIPHGWHECDGTLGTPDYRGKVLIGANATYVAGTTGGSTVHQHGERTDSAATQLTTGDKITDTAPAGDYDIGLYSHTHTFTTLDVNHMPPWAAGYWIQKL